MIAGGIGLMVPGIIFMSAGGAALVGAVVLGEEGGWSEYADDDEYISVRPLHRPDARGVVPPPPVQGLEVVWRW